MMKLSDELVRGFALGEAALREHTDEVTRALVMEVDKAMMLNSDTMMGPERSIEPRFRELLAQHPELTRLQAYAQAVLEIGDRVIAEAVKRMENNDEDESVITRARIGNFDEYRYCTMKVAAGDGE